VLDTLWGCLKPGGVLVDIVYKLVDPRIKLK
jgi:hypothetical protein